VTKEKTGIAYTHARKIEAEGEFNLITFESELGVNFVMMGSFDWEFFREKEVEEVIDDSYKPKI